MNSRQRTLLREAGRICHNLARHNHDRADEIALPSAAWQECERRRCQLDRAGRLGWQRAEKLIRERLAATLPRLLSEIESAKRAIEARPKSPPPTLRQVYEELVALDSEFNDVEFDSRHDTITVTTESIQLENVYLGPFAIVLSGSQKQERQSYLVRATDPHPADSNSSVEHPHVDGEQLCEGEGKSAIRGALAEGRLLDFFMTVRQVLSTYNGGSAYVSLESWHAVECDDCGGLVDEDERRSCDECNSAVCDGCIADCHNCDSSVCNQCSARCRACRGWHCHKCLATCLDCGNDFCKGCLSHGKCCECYKENSTQVVPTDAGVEVQPHGLGKTAVLA